MPSLPSYRTLLADFHAHPPTVAEAVAWRARAHPDAVAIRFLRYPGQPEELSFAALDARISAWAAALADRTEAGDRVLLLFQPGLDFVAAFLGCQRAGAVPVPMPLPRAGEPESRLAAVIANCAPTLVLSHHDARPALNDARLGLLVLEAEQIVVDTGSAGPDQRRAELAFLQYTSGSTGQPKGVMVSHQNVLANVQDIESLFGLRPSIRSVSWLPTYHDMGLIGCVLAPLLVAAESTLMAPASFLRHPLRWLEAIAAQRAEVSGGPNFAFDLCARRLLDERSRPDPKEIDLSSWRIAFVGAEPVRAAMLMRFAAAAAPYGFRPDSFLPCYGLAEGTLCVSGATGAPGRLIDHFDPEALGQGVAAASPRTDGGDRARRSALVACGHVPVSASTEIAIVDPDAGVPLSQERVGEIWVSSPAIAAGYWARPAESAATFGQRLPDRQGAFLRTGDLGFIHDRRLFITGRLRDVIIINGVKYHPEDIEDTIGARLPELANRRAVFAVEDEAGVCVIVLQELSRLQWRAADAEVLAAEIRSSVWDDHGVAVGEVILLAPGALPMTSSGKVQRQRCRELYLSGGIKGLRRTSAAQPRTPSHQPVSANDALKLRAILAEVLRQPTDRIGLDAPVSSFGLDSLKTVEVQMLVESRMGWEIAGEALHGEMTLLEIAECRPTAGSLNPGVFWMDAALPAALVPPPGTPDLDGDVLVTGATGLVGARIVAELLRRKVGTVFCLVRADSDDAAQRRLADHLTGAGISAADMKRRISVVRGDAALPRLGLPHERFLELSDRVAAVFHNAAKLDFVSSYSDLRAANVSGVRSIIEFAALGRPKFVGHTSSISVVESPLRRAARVAEHVPLDFPESLAVGYAQTKWVADALILHARARGFSASIFRPSWIVGPADSSPSGDFLARFLDGCRRIGALPASAYRWDIVAAPFVARAIVGLAWADAGRQPTYHIGASRRLDIPQLAGALRRLGVDLDIVPVEDWRSRLRAAFAEDPAHPLRAVASLFLNDHGRRPAAETYLCGQVPEMDSRRTLKRLRQLNLADASSSDELLSTLLYIGARRGAPIPAAAD
jgi:thioester reductase-like protein